ncbi:nitrite reductase large subunit NirB [Bacillus sp. 03113]|uniref:nitrite reductase large subunit NirB n=1 Tax=Bacillus sp. 03113 TaxID=2578211 RepID=UPI001144775F|nr:nitrite reductase large subunit NirB [Bacillus sp. 03113]
MYRKKLVVIGNGMAGVRCIEEILNVNPDLFEITIFGSEPHVNYNRILLSSVLQGGTSFEDISLNTHEWYEKHQIQLYAGETVIKIDPEKRIIITDQNRETSYDKLILATGSSPFILPLPGADKEGVIAFRTIEDCKKIIEFSKSYRNSIVIGGGLLGLEAARGLINLGMNVNVVHNTSYLMQRQLDFTASRMLENELVNQGMNFLFEKEIQEIVGQHRAEGLRFKDGSVVEADLIVMAVGVRPNIQLAHESGIDTNRAILVNDFLETSIPDIYAVGECVEHRGTVYGLVKPLYEQGKVVAKHICGVTDKGYEGSVLSTQLKISGVDVFSVGQFDEDDTTKSMKVYDEIDGIYKKAVFKENKMIGAVLFGDTRDGSKLLDMIGKKKDVSKAEKANLFHSSGIGDHSIASINNSDIICNCNAVTKGAIIESVVQKGLTTVEEVKECTKASGSCGGCRPLVAELLSYIHSDEFDNVIEKKSLCTCTTLTEEEIVHEIQVQELTTLQEIMTILNWKNREGCSICIPALNYSLGMIYPEYESNQETVFVNEKMNATLQKDGTYTVIPQMYGGLTNAEQLRKIADVVEKYPITYVAVTSEQRIHLVGVKKEDLSNVWSDLNMTLSSSYGNTVQNVKTCIGEHVCQCEKQESLNLAVSLEKRFEFLLTPYRVKIGVSACMHNGAGSTTKDIGVIGIDRGWEIYIGGSSGRNVRSGELLYVAATEDEATEIIGGFIQYYRQTANYLERTWEWMERVSLIHIREVLFDKELRQHLLEALDEDAYRRKKTLEKAIH